MRLVVVLLASLFVASPSYGESVSFPSVAVADLKAGPTITAWTYRPAGSGPAPAVILLHPCGGVDAFTDKWGKRLASWGYLALAPDSFGPRGIRTACSGPVLHPTMRVPDVAGALDFLASRPEVMKGRVAVLGQSHGGQTALRAVQRKYELGARGLKGGVAMYPGCTAATDKFIALPLLMLLGAKDDWTPAADCEALRTPGGQGRLEIVVYPDAGHGFDNDVEMVRSVACKTGTCHMAYDAKADADAASRARAFLDRILRQ